MSDIRSLIKSISGKEPTPEKITRLSAIAHDCDIPKNDALFPFLVAMDEYHGTFTELPERMRQAANKVAKDAADTTKHQVNIGLVAAIHSMGPQIGDALVDHAKALNQVDKAKWIGGVVVLVTLLFSGFGFAMHASGYSGGFESGKVEGTAAAAWANTAQGKLAYELAQSGSLEMLAHCNGRGWKLTKGVCYPYSYKEGKDEIVAGWKVGQSAGGAPTQKLANSASW